jgi:hypothetical protein
MALSKEQISAAQVRWELHLAILREEERRLVHAVQERSREGEALPVGIVERLTAARAQCDGAFQVLMNSIQDRARRTAGPFEPK